jgi:hypothetical protein
MDPGEIHAPPILILNCERPMEGQGAGQSHPHLCTPYYDLKFLAHVRGYNLGSKLGSPIFHEN